MEKVNLAEKLASFTDYWNPRIVAELNRQHARQGRQVQVAHKDGRQPVLTLRLSESWRCNPTLPLRRGAGRRVRVQR
ncbi:MAG: hypothetical protein ACJ79C_18285, partial [Myxococcales bacterium]